jgi:HEAT repeat protein
MSQTPSNGSPVQAPGPPRDLPPVEPPSAGFILQLFVIPAVIVAVLVVVVALFGKLAEGTRDATTYVEAIRSGNANVRWRAAYELANLIRNEKRLAEDPRLLGELTRALDDELAAPAPDETTTQYLAAALGAFRIIQAESTSGRPVDPLATLARALAPGRPLAVRVASAESLARLAASHPDPPHDAGAVAALARAASDPEAELRQRAVFALGFHGGQAAQDALRKALEDPDRFVRYNAANALARRGDDTAQDVLREMLSTDDLQSAVRTDSPTETQHRVESIQLQALDALQKAARNGHLDLARQLRGEVESLQDSPLASVRMQAGAVLKNLQAAP